MIAGGILFIWEKGRRKRGRNENGTAGSRKSGISLLRKAVTGKENVQKLQGMAGNSPTSRGGRTSSREPGNLH